MLSYVLKAAAWAPQEFVFILKRFLENCHAIITFYSLNCKWHNGFLDKLFTLPLICNQRQKHKIFIGKVGENVLFYPI